MKVINELKQNTDEWHKFRQAGIGASDANIIMGVSKFRTRYQLWAEKAFGIRDREPTNNFITNKGHKLESKCRPLFELEMGMDFPDMIVVSSKYEFIRASMDGFNEENNLAWECKYVGQSDFELVKGGAFLTQYYPQLQHQMLASGATSNYLFVVTDDKESDNKDFPYKTAYVEVPLNPEYIEKKLLPEIFSFWNMVVEKRQPEFTQDDVLDQSYDNELGRLLDMYQSAKLTLDGQALLVNDLQEKVFAAAKHCKVTCNGVKVSQTKSAEKMVFDYKKFEKENSISDFYMKKQKGRVTKRITFPSTPQFV